MDFFLFNSVCKARPNIQIPYGPDTSSLSSIHYIFFGNSFLLHIYLPLFEIRAAHGGCTISFFLLSLTPAAAPSRTTTRTYANRRSAS